MLWSGRVAGVIGGLYTWRIEGRGGEGPGRCAEVMVLVSDAVLGADEPPWEGNGWIECCRG